MSEATMTPVMRRVRAYFAPVNRATNTPTAFDAAQSGRFALEMPPAPWVDLGWCASFQRGLSEAGIAALRTGEQLLVTSQVRSGMDATVTLEFATWGKLQLALSSGTQQMNLLATPAVVLDGASTASALVVGSAASQFSAGDLVVVDADYGDETGFVGAGVSGAYVRAGAVSDVDYVRRISLNVARVAAVANGTLTLEEPLLAGAPVAGMKAARVVGFVDREGSSFFQEWSALFVLEGEQGDRVLLYYPRLGATHGAAESMHEVAAPLTAMWLAAAFRALPVSDAVDGEHVLCYRSYLPA